MNEKEYEKYCADVADQEAIYRDLFGDEELRKLRRNAYTQQKPYLDFIREEIERKSMEQEK